MPLRCRLPFSRSIRRSILYTCHRPHDVRGRCSVGSSASESRIEPINQETSENSLDSGAHETKYKVKIPGEAADRELLLMRVVLFSILETHSCDYYYETYLCITTMIIVRIFCKNMQLVIRENGGE